MIEAQLRDVVEKSLAAAPSDLRQDSDKRFAGLSTLVREMVDSRLTEIDAERKKQAAAVPQAQPKSFDERVGPVHLLGSFFRYNLFQRRDAIVAVPMRCGAVDPGDYDLRFSLGVIAATGRIEARLRILCAWIRWAYWDGAKV